ncbi:hypothetical protein N3K66_006222 [Trichothecium roseum]|uniref:Uncharacterized protein n=1 Tax=Trichothecium roseum TaxID=47278 RepID=A0ACC0V0F0_9HYPO|nr:hypothetical protein N3K66_006222 [Trichothecium roseum]
MTAATSAAIVASLAGAAMASLGTADGACKLAADPDVYLSPGFGYELDCAPSTGMQTGLMIFVDFPDAPANDDPQNLYAEFLPGAQDWYRTSSFGRLELNVTADTSRFVRMPDAADSYDWDRGLTAEAHYKYIQDAVDAYIAAGAAVSPSDVLYVVPTAAARAISFSPTYMGQITSRSGQQVARKSITFGMDAYDSWGFKVLNHEGGHTMCLPDLYPLPSGPTGQYVGGWDLMGLISGPSPDYFAWNKWRLGWLDDEQFDCVQGGAGSTTHVLSPASDSAGAKTKGVVVKRSETEAVVIEARSDGGNNAGTCAQGVIIYRVSTTTETGKGSIIVYDTTPGSGGCGDDELNDAVLSPGGTSVFTVEEHGVTVTVTGKEGNDYSVSIEVR